MVDLLTYIAEQMDAISIPYSYGVWQDTVTYPYFVGNYDETEYRYEDNYSGGTFTLNGWARGSSAMITLVTVADTIKQAFDNAQAVVDDHTYFIRYGGTQSIPSGEEGLYRIQIILFVNEWKGE